MSTGLHTALRTDSESIRSRLRATLRSPACAPPSQADRIHRELRGELLAGALAPAARITEASVAERFGTSRTPVREALRRLESEGHLVRDASAGLLPRIPRASRMRELYEVRLALEELVARRAADHAPGVDVAGLQQLHDEWEQFGQAWPRIAADVDPPAFVHADEGFHEALARLSGNATAERHLRDVNERIRMLRIHDFTCSDRVATTIAEHTAIAAAIVAGAGDVAAERMRAHVDASAAVVEERVGAVLARMFEGGAR